MSTPRQLALGFVFLWFAVGGIAHFAAADFFLHIMPGWVPFPLPVIYVSGVIELALAAALLRPALRPSAGLALIVLIGAVSPVNINMWLHPERFPEFPPLLYSLRLVLQLFLLACVWWATRPVAGAVR